MSIKAVDIVQAIVAVLIITDPLTRGIYFRMMTAGKSEKYRRRETRRIVIAVAIILYTSALAIADPVSWTRD